MCDMCRALEGESNDNGSNVARPLEGLQKVALLLGRETLRGEREWLRYAASQTQGQPFMAEDNTDAVTQAWASLAKELFAKPAGELAGMLSAAVIELAFITKGQRAASEAASGGTGQYL